MAGPFSWCGIALAVPWATVLIYYIFKASIDITSIIIRYMHYIGVDLAKHVDPLLVTSFFALGNVILLAGLAYALEASGIWEKLLKKLEKPTDKDAEDEKKGSSHILPSYHTGIGSGVGVGQTVAVNTGSEYEGGKSLFPRAVREETDRSMASWPENNLGKPNYSYTSLIGMSILEAPHRRLQLFEIFRWISDTFPYYRTGKNDWTNSVLHNPSSNNAFIKVQGPKDDPGEVWIIVPGYEDQFLKETPSPRPTSAGNHTKTCS
ncbi:MAG: hypothetical protein Q9221_000739 [Calogaya cf. arnoldii]